MALSERRKAQSQAYYRRNPLKRKVATERWRRENWRAYLYGKWDSRLRTRFGIDAEDWARMFNTQDRRCAICRESLDGGKGTHVDHCHSTGKVRGLLCTFCNSMLGYARDRVDCLIDGGIYLERHASADAS